MTTRLFLLVFFQVIVCTVLMVTSKPSDSKKGGVCYYDNDGTWSACDPGTKTQTIEQKFIAGMSDCPSEKKGSRRCEPENVVQSNQDVHEVDLGSGDWDNIDPLEEERLLDPEKPSTEERRPTPVPPTLQTSGAMFPKSDWGKGGTGRGFRMNRSEGKYHGGPFGHGRPDASGIGSQQGQTSWKGMSKKDKSFAMMHRRRMMHRMEMMSQYKQQHHGTPYAKGGMGMGRPNLGEAPAVGEYYGGGTTPNQTNNVKHDANPVSPTLLDPDAMMQSQNRSVSAGWMSHHEEWMKRKMMRAGMKGFDQGGGHMHPFHRHHRQHHRHHVFGENHPHRRRFHQEYHSKNPNPYGRRHHPRRY